MLFLYKHTIDNKDIFVLSKMIILCFFFYTLRDLPKTLPFKHEF